MKYVLMSLFVLALNGLATSCFASQQAENIEKEIFFHHGHQDEHSINEGSDAASN